MTTDQQQFLESKIISGKPNNNHNIFV